MHERIKDIRKKHNSGFRFFADVKNRAYLVEANGILPDEMMQEDCNVLKELIHCVGPQDVGKLINLNERVDQGCRMPIGMDQLETFVTIIDKNNNQIPALIRCYLDLDDEGLISAYICTIRPLTPKELEQQEIVSVFTNDKNPSIFINRISRFMSKAPERQYAYIQFDIRNFKYINEKYGSDIGDEILSYVNDTLNIMCDENHLHCRLSADVYQVVTYYNTREEILEFIDMLDLRLHRYQDIRFSMSYGVSIAPGTSKEYRKHGDEAGLARNEGKKAVLKKAVFYEDTLMMSVKRNGAIEEIEEEALRNGEFCVYLQPKYKYDGEKARIVGAEALVRWIDSSGKIKPPMEFVPVFEKNGFILEIDKFVWEEVCKLLRRWMDEGRPIVPISVNVSRTYLRKINLVGYLDTLLERYDIPIEYLQLEITETTESEDTIEYANAFKKAGYTLLMDDFGSGYSSLSMLQNTPFDILKMDREFLVSCLDTDNGKAIVSHVISMSKDIGLDIVAEGVETKDVADFLYGNGCTVSQGYYFSKPVPVGDFENLCFG